jgi:dihydropteroate synthase
MRLAATTIRDTTFDWGSRTYIMGILNVSPESFSGDGIADSQEATQHGLQLIAEGADILDIGGESTRPGSTQHLDHSVEIGRVVPVIRALRRETGIPLSVDTYKYEVARAAVDEGADVINDIWGLKQDPRLADVAAAHDCALVLMANQRDVSPQHDVVFEDVLATVAADLERATTVASQHGVDRSKLIIDPGIGFGKTQPQNIEILRRLRELTKAGFPLLIGSSRKSVLGFIVDLPASERLEATAASVALAIANGADIVRVHDVREMKRVCLVSDAVVREGV